MKKQTCADDTNVCTHAGLDVYEGIAYVAISICRLTCSTFCRSGGSRKSSWKRLLPW